MKAKWYEKFVGCAFGVTDEITGEYKGEYIFQGQFANTDTKNGKPYQYIFEAENKPQILMMYKEARRTMGAMIDKYKGKK